MKAMTSIRAAEAPASNVWPLLGLVAAIFVWLQADDMTQRAHDVQNQLGAAAKRVSRGSAQDVEAKRAELRQVEALRQAMMQRLQSDESEQMTRAKLVFELRQKCNAIPLACQVRLADLSNAEDLKRRAADTSAEMSLESIGVSRARAVLSGAFKPQELLSLYAAFAEDPTAQWKINGLLVKGNSYELDVERLVLRQKKASNDD